MAAGLVASDLLRGFDAFRHRREARRLRRKARGEPVLAVAAGRDPKHEGILAVTGTRVLWITPWRHRSFRLDGLQGIRVATDQEQAVVTLEQPGLQLAVARMRPPEAMRLVEVAKQAARDAGNRALATRTLDDRPPDAPELPGDHAQARLDRLERMLERGSITYPEYLANRKRILERAPPPPEPPTSSWWRRF